MSTLATMGALPLVAAEFTLLHFIPGFEAFDEWAAAQFPVLPPNENIPLYANEATSILHLALACVSTLIVFTLAIITRATWAKQENAAIPGDRFSIANAVETILDLMVYLGEQVFGDRKLAIRFLPLIGSLALFIFFSNALALVPGMAPPTDATSMTLAPALVVFVVTHYIGIKEMGTHHITHLFGPALYTGSWKSPIFFVLLPLLILFHLLFFVIEVISHIARPVSLSLRLMGNMTGDHMVLGVFMGIVTWALIFPVPILFIGTIVVSVQTIVFCVLSMVYISLSIEHSEEAH